MPSDTDLFYCVFISFISVDTLSYEVAEIKDEKMKVDLQMRELEVKLEIETHKNKKTNDQYLSLVRKCREEEEKFKRFDFIRYKNL